MKNVLVLQQNSLIELMQEKPFSKVTIKEICEKADVNRSTFYAHYKDQYELKESMEKEIICQLELVLSQIDEMGGDAAIYNTLCVFLNYIKSNNNSIQILLRNDGSYQFLEQIIHLVYANLQPRFNMVSESERYTYIYLVTGSAGVVQKWIEDESTFSVEELAGLLMNIGMKA